MQENLQVADVPVAVTSEGVEATLFVPAPLGEAASARLESEGAAGRVVKATADGIRTRVIGPIRRGEQAVAASPEQPIKGLQEASVPLWVRDVFKAQIEGVQQAGREHDAVAAALRDPIRAVFHDAVQTETGAREEDAGAALTREELERALKRIGRGDLLGTPTVDALLRQLSRDPDFTGTAAAVRFFEGRPVTRDEKKRLREQRTRQFHVSTAADQAQRALDTARSWWGREDFGDGTRPKTPERLDAIDARLREAGFSRTSVDFARRKITTDAPGSAREFVERETDGVPDDFDPKPGTEKGTGATDTDGPGMTDFSLPGLLDRLWRALTGGGMR